METERDTCHCSELGYSPDCPDTFYQGNQLLHAINAESRLKPRVYGRADEQGPQKPLERPNEDPVPVRDDGEIRAARERLMMSTISPITQRPVRRAHTVVSSGSESDDLYEEVRSQFPAPLSTDVVTSNHSGRGQLRNDTLMMEQNRKSLRKFEALNIGDQTLTGLSIGGFAVDLSRAAQKASEVAPLPRSKLPIIFADDWLNFYHHFFQGLDILLGKDVVNEIVNAEKYYETTELHLLPMIEEMIKVGYEKSDSEVTVLTKKVVTSTFEVDPASGAESADRMLVVAANLWGLQYIECGMQMKEPDLKMWLQNCHMSYRTIWFNTFKSSGIPDFALSGVQTRYEHPSGRRKHRSEAPSGVTDADIRRYYEEIAEPLRSITPRKSEHGRRRKQKHQDSGIGSFFLGK